ncbi:peptidylprolyl isomerase [Pantoea sp. Aalb]|uniref:peptidylprolyl isomerase n=1 Tax=Pantoea sp. Aalb TaxID=2576762 RepID=UPI001320D6C4|nr:peptidylprolyl isomerase [Pantoea sp. Aalb]MXP67571.1 peptidylprolyl isomerase [Pantoea sp. Aalb]
MMDNLRIISKNFIFKIILALIILSFIVTGIGNYLISNNVDYAVKINGQKIGHATLEQIYNNEIERQQKILGDQFFQLISNKWYVQEIHQKVLSQLIDQVLFEQYIKDLNILISDDQVKQSIFNQLVFQTNGKFDNDKYKNLLASIGLTADQYAEALREQLAIWQLINIITNTNFILEDEKSDILELMSQQRKVRTAVLDINILSKQQTASDNEIKEYYEQNKNIFMSPESFRLSYIKIDANNLKEKETASEEEIYQWYNKNKTNYLQPQRKRFSIIQTKSRIDAVNILNDLKKGKKFSNLAKTKSIDIISAQKGGDIGWFEKNNIPDELKKINLTQKNQLSGIIKLPVGFLIVRLDDIQSVKIKPLSILHKIIENNIKQEKALNAFYKIQRKISIAASKNNKSLDYIAQVSGLKVIETGWITNNNIPDNINYSQIKQLIFNGSLLDSNGFPGNNSDLITVNNHIAFILRINAHVLEILKPLDQVKTQIINIIKYNKATQKAKIKANKIIADLKDGKKDALQSAGLILSNEQSFDRTSHDPIAQAAFNLPRPIGNSSSWGIGEDIHKNIILLTLDKVSHIKILKHQIDQIIESFIQNNVQICFESIIKNLHEKANIKYG